jgi:NADH:ubiquinone oxidoreductase subunit 5 (subunit L)/multisubunit Na+/H+ antiporter MnhA subunit
VIVSTDLSELYVFWGVGGIATYLLLSNTWSDDAATRAARLSLAVPLLTDAAFLAGVALLYSRYGQLNVDGLIPVLHSTAGAGPKALTVAVVLLFAGAAGRLALFPFHAWLTGASATPTGALAAAQGFWTLMAAGLLFKAAPLFAPRGRSVCRTYRNCAGVSQSKNNGRRRATRHSTDNPSRDHQLQHHPTRRPRTRQTHRLPHQPQ